MIGIDLFAGAGGISLGAMQAGIDVQIVVEMDKMAVETYKHNHKPLLGIFDDDIRKFEKVDIPNLKRQQLVIFGGPPCQGFSLSNRKNRSINNQKNWLFLEFIRVVSMYMPDWVVFENVKGILDTEKGIFSDQIVQELTQLGYSCHVSVLNAKDYGIPQRRDRFFIVASLHNENFEFPRPLENKVTVADAILDLPSLSNGASISPLFYKSAPHSPYSKLMRAKKKRTCENNIVSLNKDYVIERYKYIPQGGNWQNIPKHLMETYKDTSRCHSGIYHRLKLDEPSVVIGNYRKNMLIHPTEDRGLSVREAARLQSFPDHFVFKGFLGDQQQQVGNAVPPVLAKAIFDSIVQIEGVLNNE